MTAALKYPVLDPSQVGNDNTFTWRYALPLALFLVPLVPLFSFRINSWFAGLIPVVFLFSFGPLAFAQNFKKLSGRYALALGVLGVGLLSAALSIHKVQSAGVIVGAFGTVFYSAVIYLTLVSAPEPARVRCGMALLAGYLLALCLAILLLTRYLTLWRLHGIPGEDLWGYNRGMVTLVVFLPMALAMVYALAPRAIRLALVAALAVIVTWASWQSLSETAKITVFVATGLFLLALAVQSFAIGLSVAGLVAVFFLWPILTPLAYASILDGSLTLPDFGSAHRRLEMWADASRLMFNAIWFGHGPHTLRFDLVTREAFRDYHPHSGIAQTWLDLGLAGVIATLSLLVSILWTARHSLAPVAAAIVASTIVVCAANSISHGLWQSWWNGTIGLLPGLMLLVDSVARHAARVEALELMSALASVAATEPDATDKIMSKSVSPS